MTATALVGRTLGNWRLDRLLGEGGFGAVFAAENVVVQGRRAAVKVLHAEMALDADIKRRFINEASAASRAEHENIIQVFDAGVADDGTCYIVMELLVGRSLAEELRHGALAPARAAHIGAQVAGALAAAHALDIVHRDLKPDNIFLVTRAGSTDFVKVLDFGVAKLRGELGGSKTKTGMLIGTPQYMSTEQWKGAADIDGRSDVYALGMILFECVVGRSPFSCSEPYQWLYAHLNEPVPDVASLVPGCPGALSALIGRMVAKEREARPQSMSEVAALLAAPTPAPTVVSPRAVAAAKAATPLPSTPVPRAITTPPPTPRAITTRPPTVWALIALVGVGVAIAIGGFVAFRPRRAPATTSPRVAAAQPPISVERPTRPAIAPSDVPAGMIAFAGGQLHMGRDDYGKTTALDVPAHDVAVGRFALMRAEVTNRQFADFVADHQAQAPWKSARELAAKTALPVVGVEHETAQRYCAWRFERGRLPTEAEWEWAARGKAGRLYPFGDTFDPRCVNGLAGARGAPTSADAHACGATPEGLLDLAGNVWEWTSSPAAPYPGASVPSPPGAYFVVRGGSFYNTDPDELTATARQFVGPSNRFVGFRCAADL